MTLEESGRPLPFDADRGLVVEVSSQYSIKNLVEGLKGRREGEIKSACEDFGRGLMRLTIELANGKYKDRMGEIVERVAQETGISFPHRFERYVELSILGSRPLDRWNIAKATTKEMVLQVGACAIYQLMEEAGLNHLGQYCHALCLASFKVAAAVTGDDIKMAQERTLPGDGMCQFRFALAGEPVY
jgi:hypothetical protein